MNDSQSSANPSTNASSNATTDTFFSIKFNTKPCEGKQKSAIDEVTRYFRARPWRFVVQHESNSQNGWSLNVFVRPSLQDGSFKRDSVAKTMSSVLVNHAHILKVDFKVCKALCAPSQSLILDQSVCGDPRVETRNQLEPCVTPATPAASGTNSGIQNSGDQPDSGCLSKTPIRLLLSTTANADPVLYSQAVVLMTLLCRLARADHPNQKTRSKQRIRTDPKTLTAHNIKY